MNLACREDDGGVAPLFLLLAHLVQDLGLRIEDSGFRV